MHSTRAHVHTLRLYVHVRALSRRSYWEVCYFNHVCSNTDELFRVDEGQTFTCKFDVHAYRELQEILR